MPDDVLLQAWTTPLSLVTRGMPTDWVLRQECANVPDSMLPRVAVWSAEMQRIASQGGIGLAANQVGLPYRFFIESVDRGMLWKTFVNPVVLATSGGPVKAVEGCLSSPGVRVLVARPTRVTIVATDVNGREIVENATGLRARCWLHEIDHLNGKLIGDVPHA